MTAKRECDGCSLCCTLLPVPALEKAANTKCRHQRYRTGCAIYPAHPGDCRAWSCRWLADEADTVDQLRPDRAGYVIDCVPDFIHIAPQDGTPEYDLEVVQVWLDPKRPDAETSPRLLELMMRIATDQQKPTLLRVGNERGRVVFPPALTPDGEWYYHDGTPRAGYGIGAIMQRAGSTP